MQLMSTLNGGANVEVERNRRDNSQKGLCTTFELVEVVRKGPCRQLLHTMSTMRKGRKSPFWPRYACSIARLVAAWRAPYVSVAQGLLLQVSHCQTPLSFVLIRVLCVRV